jgi:hypothetical protein
MRDDTPAEMMHIRVPLELKRELEHAARADMRGLSGLVRVILTKWLDENDASTLREKPAHYGPQPSPAVPAASRANTKKRRAA